MHKSTLQTLVAITAALFIISDEALALQKPEQAQSQVLSAISDFSQDSEQEKIWYIDQERGCLAVDAALHKNQFATVRHLFSGGAGRYALLLTSLTEVDGESEYRLSINGNAVGVNTNPESDTDFAKVQHDFGAVTLAPGDSIEVSFNSTTNGKIPEDGGTAFARGRWTKLTLTPLP